MFDSLGFSYIGLLFILMLTIPNLLWTQNQPKNYNPNQENKWLVFCERFGQVLVTTLALLTPSFNITSIDLWTIWLFVAFFVMCMYESWWIRYFKSEHTLQDFYSSYFGVPVAGATLPVIAFFLLGVYGRSIAMIISITILGVGHIGVHFGHKKISDQNNATKSVKS